MLVITYERAEPGLHRIRNSNCYHSLHCWYWSDVVNP